MISLQNIHALDHFKRNTATFRKRLRKTGQPEVLTVDGRAELVVQSAEAYQGLIDTIDRLEAVRGIQEGLADAQAWRTRSADQVHKTLRRKFKIPRDA